MTLSQREYERERGAVFETKENAERIFHERGKENAERFFSQIDERDYVKTLC